LLGLIVVASNEHVRFIAGQAWVDRDVCLDDIEALDDVRVGNQALDALTQRISGPDEQSWPSRGEVERIAGVDHDLACEALHAGEPDDLLGGTAEDRQHDELAELGSLGKGPDLRPRTGRNHPRNFAESREPIMTGWPFSRNPVASVCPAGPEPRTPIFSG
jgi:hypothetical protein